MRPALAVTGFLLKRLLFAAGTLLAVSLAVFAATEILPGDVAGAVLGQSATPEALAALRASMHLDLPASVRYLHWLGGMVTGDVGHSLVNNRPVSELIGSRLPNSLLLAGAATAFCVPIGLLLGICSAMRPTSVFDRVTSVATLSIVAVPEFFIGTLAVLVFAVNLRWFPALTLSPRIDSVEGFFRSMTLPVLSLSGIIIAQIMRMTRAALLDVLRRPYVEMARLKGVVGARLVLFYALPNALGPIANALALSLSHLLGGAIIIETIFNFPGLAKLLVDAVSTRDMPLVQACTMLFCLAYLILGTLADIAGMLANPRLRAS
ncbi:MAG: ABC transporter permease [Rhodospirillales bacterium]|nr:ABC transporter permease [Rhodospirillales bacterium]